MHRLIAESTISDSSLITIYYDSQAAIRIARNLVIHERTKNIEVDFHFLRNKLQEGLISFQHVATTEQLANILTNALISVKHVAILSKLTVKTSPPT